MASTRLHSGHCGPQCVVHRQPKPTVPTAPALLTTSLNNLNLHTTTHFPDGNDEETFKPRVQNRAQTFEQQLEHLTYLRGVITRERRHTSWMAGWGNQPSYKYRSFQLERILIRFDAIELDLLRSGTKGIQEKLTSEEEKNDTLQHELNRARFEKPAVRARADFITEGWDAASPASSVVCKPAAPTAPPFLTSLPTSSSTHSLDLLTAALFPADDDKDSSNSHPRARTFDEQLEHLSYLRLVITLECDEAMFPTDWEQPPPYRLAELEQILARIDVVELSLLRTETSRLQEKLAVSEKNNERLQHQLAGRDLEGKDGGEGMRNGAGRFGLRYDAWDESPPASVHGERRVAGGDTADELCDDHRCCFGHASSHASESDYKW